MIKSLVSLMFVTSQIIASDGVVNMNKQTGTYTVGSSNYIKSKIVQGASDEMKGFYPIYSPKGMNGMMPRNFK